MIVYGDDPARSALGATRRVGWTREGPLIIARWKFTLPTPKRGGGSKLPKAASEITDVNVYTSNVNISKALPSKASGLGGVVSLRSKSAPILYKYRFV